MKVHIDDKCCHISRAYIESFKMVNNIEFSSLEDADIICYIGCAYSKERMVWAIEDIYGLISKKNKKTKLAVFGCATVYEKFYNYINELCEIDYIGRGYGAEMQKELTKYLENQLKNELAYTPMAIRYENDERINIVVQDGCTRRCSFCKSNYLNFSLKSVPFDTLISQLSYFTNSNDGIKEINISGLNPTEYGLDLYGHSKLTDLIQEISKMPSVETILLESLCLDRMNDELVNEILTNRKIKRVMIPVQSMDDRLLKLMGRKSTSKEAYDVLNAIATIRPDIFIETIFLICYPTETKECIKKNIQLLEDVRIHNPVLSVYKYGKNVETLKSEHIKYVSKKEHRELLKYYSAYMIPLMEQQRRELLSNPVEGRLVEKNEYNNYYSTLYRFTTNEFVVKCTPNEQDELYQKALIQTEFLEKEPGQIYTTKSDFVNGKVLSRILR